MKVTHGNWKAVKVPNRNWSEIHYTDDGECVAEVVHNEADAILMAASKEMYEALAAIEKALGDRCDMKYVKEYTLIRKAIARATQDQELTTL